MTQSETWTVGRLLTWTTDFLRRSGSESPRLDSEILLANARGCPRIALYTAFDEVVPDDVRSSFRDLVKRRAGGTPVAYLVGRKEFYSLSFRVTPDVLIPRPETEHLVIAALEALEAMVSSTEVSCADVGTGSGAIGITLAKRIPSVRVVATDISPAALAVARQNAEDHQVLSRITFYETDLLSAVPAGRTFDVIVSNPPYIGERESDTLAPQVRDHEPAVALFGGPTGTEIIARLIPQAADRLKAGGVLLMEVSPLIADSVAGLIAVESRFKPPIIDKDLAGHARVIKTSRR